MKQGQNWDELMNISHSADDLGLTGYRLPGMYKESADIVNQLQQYSETFKLTVLEEIAEYYGLKLRLVDRDKLVSRSNK